MNRKPTPKSQAEIIIAELAGLGFTLQRGKALDLVAKLEGYKGWNELLKAQKKAKASAAVSVPKPSKPTLKYDAPIPAELFSRQGAVSDEVLAIHFKQARVDSVRSILYDVTHTGKKAPADCSFGDLDIGETFWDSDCGEDFVKTGPTTAHMIPTYGDSIDEGPDDTFLPEICVKRELYSLELCGDVRFKVTIGGKVEFITSRNGMTDDMEAILAGTYPDRAESVGNPWFQWVNADGEAVGDPFSELPKDPMDAIRHNLLPNLARALEERFRSTVNSRMVGFAGTLLSPRSQG